VSGRLRDESPTCWVARHDGCLLEGATWRNAAGEEPSEQVVDECYQEAKRATMFARYSPDVLRACLRERGYRPYFVNASSTAPRSPDIQALTSIEAFSDSRTWYAIRGPFCIVTSKSASPAAIR
jgi:hypothetical protein